MATTSFDDSPEGLGLVIVLAAMIGDSGRRGGKISQGKARGRSPGKPGAGFRGASGRAVPQDLPDSPDSKLERCQSGESAGDAAPRALTVG